MRYDKPENKSMQSGKIVMPKSSFWKFFIPFVVIIILVGGFYFIWMNRLSPEAKERRAMDEQVGKIVVMTVG